MLSAGCVPAMSWPLEAIPGHQEDLGAWARLLGERLTFVTGHAAHATFGDLLQRLPVDAVLGDHRHPAGGDRPQGGGAPALVQQRHLPQDRPGPTSATGLPSTSTRRTPSNSRNRSSPRWPRWTRVRPALSRRNRGLASMMATDGWRSKEDSAAVTIGADSSSPHGV
jgi:hypothetical protein